MALSSPVKKIKNISFVNLTSGQPVRAERIVRRNQVTIVKLKGGGYWCSHVDGRYWYPFGRNPSHDDVLRALVDIKAITEAEYNRHMKMYVEYEEARKLKEDTDALARLIDKHGSIEELRRKIDLATGVEKRENEPIEVIAAEGE